MRTFGVHVSNSLSYTTLDSLSVDSRRKVWIRPPKGDIRQRVEKKEKDCSLMWETIIRLPVDQQWWSSLVKKSLMLNLWYKEDWMKFSFLSESANVCLLSTHSSHRTCCTWSCRCIEWYKIINFYLSADLVALETVHGLVVQLLLIQDFEGTPKVVHLLKAMARSQPFPCSQVEWTSQFMLQDMIMAWCHVNDYICLCNQTH